MKEIILSIVTDEAFVASFSAVILVLAQRFMPSKVPFLGKVSKTVEELIALHNMSQEDNSNIIAKANSEGYSSAARALEKRLRP